MTIFFKYFSFKILKIQNSLQGISIYVYPIKDRVNFLIRYVLYYEKSLLTKYFLRTIYGIKILKKQTLFLKIQMNKKKGQEKKLILFSSSLLLLIFKILILK